MNDLLFFDDAELNLDTHSLSTNEFTTNAFGNKFVARLDAPQLNGYFLSNEYNYGQIHPNPINETCNPFSFFRKKYGNQDLKVIWENCYIDPYKIDDNWVKLLSALCTGSSAVVANIYDRRRLYNEASMSQRSSKMLNIWINMLFAQCKVFTDDILRHFKYFSFHRNESLKYLWEIFGENKYTPVITFVPQATLNIGELQKRMLRTHSVVVKGCQMMDNGSMIVYVWDPNLPADDNRNFILTPQGDFDYYTEYDKRVIITSKELSMEPFLGGMAIAPWSNTLLINGKQPYFNGWNVLFG